MELEGGLKTDFSLSIGLLDGIISPLTLPFPSPFSILPFPSPPLLSFSPPLLSSSPPSPLPSPLLPFSPPLLPISSSPSCFSLAFYAAHKPRLWVEEQEDKSTWAAMMVLYPEFNVGIQRNTEYIVVVDRFCSFYPFFLSCLFFYLFFKIVFICSFLYCLYFFINYFFVFYCCFICFFYY
jgi:hypothetical protein